MTEKKEMSLKNVLFLIIGILLAALLIIKIIEKDTTAIVILCINSIIVLVVFLILRKQREKMLKALDEDLKKSVEEIKKRGRKYTKTRR